MPFQVSDPIGSLAWAFLALQVLLVWGAWRSRAALEAGEELPPPGVLYGSVILQGLLLHTRINRLYFLLLTPSGQHQRQGDNQSNKPDNGVLSQ